MSSTHVQYILPEKGGNFQKRSVTTPAPGPNEVNIRTKAIGLNPVDEKNWRYGILIQSWPTILGLEFAGVVESVGGSVTDFKSGDEVVGIRAEDEKGTAFQEIITVPSVFLIRKPASFTFEEAASLPIGYFTAAPAVVAGLGVPLPWVKAPKKQSPKSILIIGGSSAVGTSAIQILREILPSVQILTTSAAKHHAHLKSLGATECFERSVQDEPSAVRKAAVGGNGVDAILDTVAAAAEQPTIFDALDPAGPKIYSHIATGVTVSAPEGVSFKTVYAKDILNYEGGSGFLKAMGKSIENGTYKLPVRVEVVGKGLDAIPAGLEQFVKGVSGTKLVVSL